MDPKQWLQDGVRVRWIVAGVFTTLYVIVVVRIAWITDDAYISLRTVDNVVQGYGLCWNAVDRVQSFTHPLWVLLLSLIVAITREIYVTTILVSIVLATCAYFLLIARASKSLAGAVTGGLILILAPGFVTYSTSGLENPLSFLLVVLFMGVFLRHPPGKRRSFMLAFLVALATVNRVDLALLLVPALGVDLYRHRHFRAAAAGLIPALLWFVFSLVYYGFLFPNTAYSKLSTGVSITAYIRQGLYYLLDALERDTLAAVTVAVVMVLGLVGKDGARRALSIGIVFYLFYLVWVGGDFMLGRLLTVPLVVAVGVLLDGDLFTTRPWRWAGVAVVTVLGMLAPTPTLLSGSDFGSELERGAYFKTHGIAKEREFYYQRFGLLNGKPLATQLGHDIRWLRERQAKNAFAVRLVAKAGENGLTSHPETYVIDICALGDALLARLPIRHTNWRIGHFYRVPPSGYLLTVATGENHIRDPRIHAYYEHIRAITRGPLFDAGRWASIIKANTGQLRGLLRGNDAYEPMGTVDYLEFVEWNVEAAGPKILWGAAKHYCETHDLDRASPLLARLSRMERPDDQDYVKEATQIAIDGRSTHPAFSEKTMRLLRELEPLHPEAAWGLAVVLYETDRVDEAIEHMEFAARLGHEGAKQALEKLGR